MDDHGFENRGLLFKDADESLVLLTIIFKDRCGAVVKNYDYQGQIVVDEHAVGGGDIDDLYSPLPMNKAEIVEYEFNEVLKTFRLSSVCAITFAPKGAVESVPAYEAARKTSGSDPVGVRRLIDSATRIPSTNLKITWTDEADDYFRKITQQSPRRFDYP